MSKAHIETEANPEALVALLVVLLLVVVFVQQSGLLSASEENPEMFRVNVSETQTAGRSASALRAGL